MRKFAIIAAMLGTLSFAACTKDPDSKQIQATHTSSDGNPALTVEGQIAKACKRDDGQWDEFVSMTMATRKVGYGSATDYFVVVCRRFGSGYYAVRVEVD